MGSDHQHMQTREAEQALRQIASNWRQLVRLANLAKQSSRGRDRALAVLTAGFGVILEAAAFVSQGDDCDRDELAARLADGLLNDEAEINRIIADAERLEERRAER